MPDIPYNLKAQVVAGIRQLIVASVTAGIIVGSLILGFAGQNANEREVREATLHATLATACVLALPVDPETGRDQVLVQFCFTQYGLEAPLLHN